MVRYLSVDTSWVTTWPIGNGRWSSGEKGPATSRTSTISICGRPSSPSRCVVNRKFFPFLVSSVAWQTAGMGRGKATEWEGVGVGLC